VTVITQLFVMTQKKTLKSVSCQALLCCGSLLQIKMYTDSCDGPAMSCVYAAWPRVINRCAKCAVFIVHCMYSAARQGVGMGDGLHCGL